MYSVLLSIGNTSVCEVELKSITKVCKFLETVNFELVKVEVLSPYNSVINVDEIMEIWYA